MGRRAQVAIACLLAACEGGDATLVVQVRTDLAPGRELAAVRVVVEGGATRETPSGSARDWGLGVRVAELSLPRGTHRLRVAALDGDGAVVVERPVRAELSGGVRVVTVLLTRDCAGVSCPGAGDDAEAIACVGGRCVLASCVEEDAPSCATECTSVSSCGAASVECATMECTGSGTCFEAPDHARCGAGSVCLGGDGCVPEDAVDGGVPDDAGTCDFPCGLLPQCGCMPGEACRYTDVVGNVCDVAGPAAAGAPCSVSSDCASALECFVEAGECVRYCRADADCGAAERCVYQEPGAPVGLCFGTLCDPVADVGCQVGATCRLANAFDPEGFPLVVPSCEVFGTAGQTEACTVGADCAAGLGCFVNPTRGSYCRAYCETSADCGTADSLCVPVEGAPPPGLCTDVCDLVAGSGCGTGRACRLATFTGFDGSTTIVAKLCAADGAGTDGSACSTHTQCAGGFFCVGTACRQICDLGAPRCARGSCTELVGDFTIGGVTHGVCL